MRNYSFKKLALVLMFSTLVFISGSYATDKGEKVPITTSSKEALKLYMQGRELAEKLRGQESRQYFENAVTKDPNFAMGYLNLAFNQPSAKGFFENLDKAQALIDKVSEGERLWISGVQAGVNGFTMKQRENYKKLVAAYPNDERVQNLLGNHYFGQQEYAMAIAQYEKAIKLNPNFSPPYNQLGYAQRLLGNYTESEKAFKKYITLIPDDPNPRDSYAELLLKMGKFDESIENYKKALSINPGFVFSHIGIATNLNFKGNHEEAREQLQKMYENAKDDGQRRQALFAKTVCYVDEGKFDRAFGELDKQYVIAEKINDAAAMAGDLTAMGNILLDTGKPDEAIMKFDKALKIMKGSNLSKEIKDNAKRFHLFNAARVDLKKKDFATAKTKSEKYLKHVEAINNPNQIRLSHQLAGMIALEEKDYDKALAELQQANQQDPYNIYRMALAYEGKGDNEKATGMYKKAANFNALNNINYAFIRSKAKQIVAAK